MPLGLVSLNSKNWLFFPLNISKKSEPQPDLEIVHYREDYYASGHRQSNDILLLIEVSDSTSKCDHEVKLPLYARSSIPEVWIVSLEEQILEAYRRPCEDTYGVMQYYQRGEVVKFRVVLRRKGYGKPFFSIESTDLLLHENI